MESVMATRSTIMDYDGILTSAWWAAHIASPFALIGTFFGLFPLITSVVVFVFYVVQLYESKTVQGWLARRRTTKLLKLRARILMLEELDRDNVRHSTKGHH